MQEKQSFGSEVRANLRALRRFVLGFGLLLPVTLAGAWLQKKVFGPLTGNYTAFPRFVFFCASKLFGINTVYKGELEKSRPTWFFPNHMSTADFLPLSMILKTFFVMKGDIAKWPVIKDLTRVARFIGINRSQKVRDVMNSNEQSALSEEDKKKDYERKLAEDRGQIIQSFNGGGNVTTFLEGTTTAGDRVLRFSAGLLAILFNEAGADKKGNAVKLEKDVVVQPLAMRVQEINGENVIDDSSKWEPYTLPDDNMLVRMWKRAKIKSLTLEVTAFPALEPKNFASHTDLANEAHRLVTSVVAPQQTVIQTPGDYVRERKAKKDNTLQP